MLLLSFIYFVYRIMNIVVLVYVLLSWVAGMNPTLAKAYYFLAGILEPLLKPIRKLMWPVTRKIGLDFSPYILIVAMGLIYRILASLIIYGGIRI